MAKIKGIFKQYETKIILVAGFILVALVSFEAGLIQGKKSPANPLIVEKTTSSTQIQAKTGDFPELVSDTTGENKPATGQNLASPETPKNCAYVGSKNSNKYHLPTCTYAKKIKPENLVCFSSAEDAQAKNYQPDKSCVK